MLFCTDCSKVITEDLASLEMANLFVQSNITLTQVSLSSLKWKENIAFRGGPSLDPAKQKRDHARQYYKRAIKGVRNEQGQRVSYAGCADRWDKDPKFQQQLIAEHNYTRKDMEDFDALAQEPPLNLRLPKAERQKRYTG